MGGEEGPSLMIRSPVMCLSAVTFTSLYSYFSYFIPPSDILGSNGISPATQVWSYKYTRKPTMPVERGGEVNGDRIRVQVCKNCDRTGESKCLTI